MNEGIDLRKVDIWKSGLKISPNWQQNKGVCRKRKWWLALVKSGKIREEDGGSRIESRETERVGIAVSF